MALRLGKLFGLMVLAIAATYFTTKTIASVVHIGLVIAYLFDKDEALWLTFYFVISDGFLGFFNNYDAVVSILPGLPAVEVGHLYILATIVKVRKIKEAMIRPFHQPFLAVMLVYVLFLIAQGYAIGVTSEMKYHFRILKNVLPLTLFYTLPRLFVSGERYRDTFHFFIPFAFWALFAQLFTLASGIAPSQALGVRQDLWFTDLLERGQTYRGFYSTGMVLLSFFGALYYATIERASRLRALYMAVIVANILSAFLSATRGWVLSFTVILFLHALFVMKLDIKRIAVAGVVGAAVLFGLMRIPAIQKQFEGATERILTIGLMAKGDVTAGGTLERLDRRAPRVMGKWRDSKLTGWGFSDDFNAYTDSHVGNHNILLHSGIIGAILLASFLVWYCWMLLAAAMPLPPAEPLRQGLLVFPIFLLGWLIIHSSSGQQFFFYGEPAMTIAHALYFSFGADRYQAAMEARA